MNSRGTNREGVEGRRAINYLFVISEVLHGCVLVDAPDLGGRVIRARREQRARGIPTERIRRLGITTNQEQGGNGERRQVKGKERASQFVERESKDRRKWKRRTSEWRWPRSGVPWKCEWDSLGLSHTIRCDKNTIEREWKETKQDGTNITNVDLEVGGAGGKTVFAAPVDIEGRRTVETILLLHLT